MTTRTTLSYTDTHGKRQTLTRPQWERLAAARRDEGGYWPSAESAPPTLRMLADRGVLVLTVDGPFAAATVTPLGLDLLARWVEPVKMGRPGEPRPEVGLRLGHEDIGWWERRALGEGVTIRGGEPNLSEVLRLGLEYAKSHMPKGWRP